MKNKFTGMSVGYKKKRGEILAIGGTDNGQNGFYDLRVGSVSDDFLDVHDRFGEYCNCWDELIS